MSIEEHLHYLLTNTHETNTHGTYYIEPQVITALENSRYFAAQLLAGLTLDEVTSSFSDLKRILKFGEERLFSDLDINNLSHEAKNMAYDDFETLKFTFENHLEEVRKIGLESSLSKEQFYCLLALHGYANAHMFIDKTRFSINVPDIYLKQTLSAAVLALTCNKITSHVYATLFGDIAQETIDNLKHKALAQSKGGIKASYERYGNPENRALRKQNTINNIWTEAEKIRENNKKLSAQAIKLKISTNLNISKSTIDKYIPQFASKFKKKFPSNS